MINPLEDDLNKLYLEVLKYPLILSKLSKFLSNGGRIVRCIRPWAYGIYSPLYKEIEIRFNCPYTLAILFHELIHYEQHILGILPNCTSLEEAKSFLKQLASLNSELEAHSTTLMLCKEYDLPHPPITIKTSLADWIWATEKEKIKQLEVIAK